MPEKLKDMNLEILCLCGCGTRFLKFDKKRRPRKYVSGHNPSWNSGKDSRLTVICKHCSSEFKFYRTKSKGQFCSKKCQHEFDYPGCVWKGKNGYLYFQKSRKAKFLVHRLIADAPKGSIVHHKDHNKLNNSLDNLELIKSQSEHLKRHWVEGTYECR